jgi:thiamine pyrophosphate-dependent acetolactate synthase large subunit-like protein
MTGSDLVVQFLKSLPAQRVFGLPGSTMVSLMHSLHTSGVEFVSAVHESSAVAMADGYSRIAGPTAVLLYMLPGTANGLGNLYNAYRDESQLLVIVSQQVSRARTKEGSVGEADTAALVQPFMRFAWEVRSRDQLLETLHRATMHMTGPPAGPAFVALPEDVLIESSQREDLSRSPLRTKQTPPDPDEVADRLVTAERPVIVAGGQVRRAGGASALERLAAALEIPVFIEPFWNDRLAISPSHRCYLGPFTERSRMVREADLVLAIGCRLFNEVHPLAEPWFRNGTFIAHVNADAQKLGETMVPNWSATADPGRFLSGLLDSGIGSRLSTGTQESRSVRLAEARARRERREQTPLALAGAAVAENLDRAWIVDESVSGNFYLTSALRGQRGDHFISTTGGSLGWGPSAAVGVALATGESVVCYLGDGAFFFGVHGLWPASARNLPITYVVLDNRGFGSTRWFEDRHVKLHVQGSSAGHIGSDFGDRAPSVADVARGFGVPARVLTGPGELAHALDEAVQHQKGPSLLVVPIPFA